MANVTDRVAGVRYFPGEIVRLTKEEKKRCLAFKLTGQSNIDRVLPLAAINANWIVFCFGAKGVRVRYEDGRAVSLLVWLNQATTEEFQNVVGFSGPEKGVLYIVFKKSVLNP